MNKIERAIATVAFELLMAIALALAIVATITTIAAHAQQSSFYGPNGSFAGSSVTIGNSTSFYGPNGNYAGSSTRVGNSTSLYDSQGRYQGSVTTMPAPSFDRAFNFKR